MSYLYFDMSEATLILYDNCAATSIVKNPVLHSKRKHIKVKYHAAHYYEEKKEIKTLYYCTEGQVADIFTKPLNKAKFEALRTRLGVDNLSPRRRLKAGDTLKLSAGSM